MPAPVPPKATNYGRHCPLPNPSQLVLRRLCAAEPVSSPLLAVLADLPSLIVLSLYIKVSDFKGLLPTARFQ